MNERTEQMAANFGRRAVAWLKGRGWGETLAKATVAGALGAALGIAAALGLTACTTHFTATPQGAVEYTQRVEIPLVSDILTPEPQQKNNE